jgi:anaerobic magnesium-protoporphyrin IX monomethyl ester cyclase
VYGPEDISGPFSCTIEKMRQRSMAQRVLLVNPFYPISETPSPPLGLAYLAGALEAAGVRVEILDLVVMPKTPSTLADALNRFQPHVVGVTAVTMSAETAFDLLREVKTIAPDTLTVMGGPHATFSTKESLAAVPELDVIVRGEGEQTFLALLAEKDRGRWQHIPGLAFRTNGGICQTSWREPVNDLSQLPDPARHGLPLGRYRTLGMPVSVTTSRGCPFECIFCVGRRMVGARVRYRPPVRVVDEIEHLAALGFRQVNVADDLFTANPRHCLAICDEILRRSITIRWSSFARVDTVSVALLTRMREAGCHAVSFGIESGSPDILKRVRKKITLEQAERAVVMCRQAGMQAHASFILGLPGETPETLAQTMTFARRLEDQGLFYGFHLLAPFPGTAIGDAPDTFGLQVLSRHWPDYHANRAICLPHGMDPAQLDAIAEGWQARFLDYLADIQRRMPNGAASEEEAAMIHNMNRTAILYEMMMAGTLEKLGPCAGGGMLREPDGAAVDDLARRVRPLLPNWAHDTIHDALRHAHAREGLRLERAPDGKPAWRWVDYLPAQ